MNMDSTLSAVVTEYNSTCNSLSLTEEKRVKLKLFYKLDNVPGLNNITYKSVSF